MPQTGIWTTLNKKNDNLNKKMISTSASNCLVSVEFFVTTFPPVLPSQVWLKLQIFGNKLSQHAARASTFPITLKQKFQSKE